jgi:hypothetical protein
LFPLFATGVVTPVPNLPQVSTTQAKLVAKFAASVIDTGGKFAAGVVDTSGAGCLANIPRILKTIQNGSDGILWRWEGT